jgi:hypothetical protein
MVLAVEIVAGHRIPAILLQEYQRFAGRKVAKTCTLPRL